MRTHLNQVPALAWIALAIPAILVAHSVFVTVLSQVLRAVVPDTVRSVLSILG